VKSNYDVVILGSGIAGLSAALAAHEAGLKPLLLEKSDLLGGGTTNSYGLIWVGENHIQLDAGLKDNRSDIISYMRFLGGGEHNEERLVTFVERSPAVLKRFADWGIPFRLVRGVTDHYFGMAPGAVTEGRTLEAELISGFELGPWKDRIVIPDDVPCYVTAEEQVLWGGMNRFSQWDQDVVRERKARDMRGKGLGLVCHFVKALNDRGIAIKTGQKIQSLLFDGQRVAGVRMAGGTTIPAAKGVVLATGGYDWNVKLARDLEGLPDLVPMGPESLTGDGLVLGAEVGANIHRIQNSLFLMLGYTVPSTEPGRPPVSCRASIVELFCPHTMVVNRAGKRFADESFFQGIVPTLRQFDTFKHEYPNLPCYLIFDWQYLNQFSFGNRPVGAPVPETIPRADNLPDLAKKLGISVEGFMKTIERFNDFARAGIDQDFHRGELKWKLASAKGRTGKNPALGTIETPPFYGVELLPSIANSAGLVANTAAQVMNHRKLPIPGLYASGVVAVRDEGGAGYQAGLTLAAAMTFSYLAVEHMVRGSNGGHLV
jgi:3-oxosteroid 1-dehydrogenase